MPDRVAVDVHRRPRRRPDVLGLHHRHPERGAVPPARRGHVQPDVLPPDRRHDRARLRGHDLRHVVPGAARPVQMLAAGVPAAGRWTGFGQGGSGRVRPEPAHRRRRPRAGHPGRVPRVPGGSRRSSSQLVEGIHAAFSLATAQTFWLGVAGSIVAVVAAVAIKEIPLRATNDAPVPTDAGRPPGLPRAHAVRHEPRPAPTPTDRPPSPLLHPARPDAFRGGRASIPDMPTHSPPRSRRACWPPASTETTRTSEAVLDASATCPPGTHAAGHASATSTCSSPTRPRHRRDRRSLPAHGRAAVDRRARRLHRRLPAPRGPVRPRAAAIPAQMPTTGGLDPDGVYHPTWSPAGARPQGRPAGQEGRGPPADPGPPLPLLPGPHPWTTAIEVALPRGLTRAQSALGARRAVAGGSDLGRLRSAGCPARPRPPCVAAAGDVGVDDPRTPRPGRR